MKFTEAKPLRLPRTPVLDWSTFSRDEVATTHSVGDIEHSVMTTSGRAAIYQALQQLRPDPGSIVLAPTYHCPTMIAPIILSDLEVAYFGIGADGTPNLETIDATTARKAKAMIVSHYFGLAGSLADVRNWCDKHHIALIEDCAHSFFGSAGERPVGSWGDYATASLSKFFPVPEGGVLASNRHPIKAPRLSAPGLRMQVKAWVDVLELAIGHGRLAGVNGALASLFRIRDFLGRSGPNTLGNENGHSGATEASSVATMMRLCDMQRILQAPTLASRTLMTAIPRGRIIARRRQNFATYAQFFANVSGARPLFSGAFPDAVPYVFPLWIDEPDLVYQTLRAQSMPVFRWNNLWPDTPRMPDDVGPAWSHHVLQLLCHQDLSEADVTRTALATLRLLSDPRTPTSPPTSATLT